VIIQTFYFTGSDTDFGIIDEDIPASTKYTVNYPTRFYEVFFGAISKINDQWSSNTNSIESIVEFGTDKLYLRGGEGFWNTVEKSPEWAVLVIGVDG